MFLLYFTHFTYVYVFHKYFKFPHFISF